MVKQAVGSILIMCTEVEKIWSKTLRGNGWVRKQCKPYFHNMSMFHFNSAILMRGEVWGQVSLCDIPNWERYLVNGIIIPHNMIVMP